MSDMPASYWRPVRRARASQQFVQCDLCPRACVIAEDHHGVCGSRMNEGGAMILDSYGRLSGIAADPVEKKPLFHFMPGTRTLSFGTIGCNLKCRFCQNHAISAARDPDRLGPYVAPADIAAAARRERCASVAFTYNEPAIFMEYAVDTAIACHEAGLKTIAVTAGYMNDAPRRAFFAHIDAVNIDLKSFSRAFYTRVCGADLAPVLDTIRHVARETTTWMELTTLLIPGENDSTKEIHKLCAWIVHNTSPDTPLHFSAFHPDWKMRDRPATPVETLQRAREIALEHGLRHVYTGNIPDADATTRCHSCGRALLVRTGFTVRENALREGACPDCGTSCPGRWR